MKNTLQKYRKCVSERRLYRDIIDAALDDAWANHVEIFLLHGTELGDEEKWKDALLAKWVERVKDEK